MRHIKIFFLILFLLASGSFVIAQDEPKQEVMVNKADLKIPEGMEAIQIGGSAKLIVPKGAKTRKVGAQIIVEGTKEYMARRFAELDKRITELEKREELLKKEIDALKKTTPNKKENKASENIP